MQLALCCIRFQSLWNARNRSSLAFGAAPFRRAGHTVDGSKRTRKFAPIAPYEDIAFLQSHTRARAAWQAPKCIRRSATSFHPSLLWALVEGWNSSLLPSNCLFRSFTLTPNCSPSSPPSPCSPSTNSKQSKKKFWFPSHQL
eukprot:5258663-Pleurochrysis_carterae.AAC.3